MSSNGSVRALKGKEIRDDVQLADQIVNIFAGTFAKMNIARPELEAAVSTLFNRLNDLTTGVDYTLDSANIGANDELLLNGRRTLVYIDTNASPRVHSRYCATIQRMHSEGRAHRYIAKLPTRRGFLMHSANRVTLELCKFCQRLEQSRKSHSLIGSSATAVEGPGVIASVLAEFATGGRVSRRAFENWANQPRSEHPWPESPDSRDKLKDISRYAENVRASIESMAEESERKRRLNDADTDAPILTALARMDVLRQDLDVLEKLSLFGAISEADLIKTYRSAELARSSFKYFDAKPWRIDATQSNVFYIASGRGSEGVVLYLAPSY